MLAETLRILVKSSSYPSKSNGKQCKESSGSIYIVSKGQKDRTIERWLMVDTGPKLASQ